MLNWAARYYPILRVLKQHGLLSAGSVLEIGSGPFGLGTFRKVPFVGCDLSFPPMPPDSLMTPVVASAAELPFEGSSFDAVVASDILEHVGANLRARVISESLRVARRLVVFGFPSGAPAHEADAALRDFYAKKSVEVPAWLEEHMLEQFPEQDLFRDLPDWKVEQFGNENIDFHSWMMRQETHNTFVRASFAFRRFAPRLLERLLRRADKPPYYRQIFVLSRQS